jgi:hypothetical protein
MKKVNYPKIVYPFFLIISFIAGITIGKFITFPFFEIDKHLNVVEISSILTTLIAAYLITNVLEKSKQNFRVEKDLLIKRLEDIDHMYDDISLKIDSANFSYSEAASIIKRIRTSFTCLFKLLENTKINFDSSIKENMAQEISELKDLLTDTPQIADDKISRSNLPIDVKNDVLILSRSHLLRIETKLNSLKNACINLQFEINKG